MAQYDVLLVQNTHATLTEFTEKYINIGKGGLLTADSSKTPMVVAVGTDGQVLIADSASTGGFKWVAQSTLVGANSHVQGTDLGTTNADFGIQTGGFNVHLVAESASKMSAKVAGLASYADWQANNGIYNKITLPSSDPVGAYDAAHKTYVDNKFAALNGALLFKGNIKTTGGDITPTAFNALATYSVGWQYRAAEAGTFQGVVCEIGDMLTAIVARSGSGALAADWTVSQTNIDGAVVGPATAIADNIASYNGATGKLIKDSGVAVSAIASAQATATAAIPKSAYTATDVLLVGSGAGTYTTLTPSASTIVGKAAAGGVVALSAAQVLTILGISNAVASDINTGTDNVKFITSSALAGSNMAKGPGSSVANRIAIFTGTDGKTLGDSGKIATDFMENWVSAPSTKTSTGTAGQKAYDSNFFYVCQATNVWKRTPIATNW